jgi:phosphate transport system substrate-binding protein
MTGGQGQQSGDGEQLSGEVRIAGSSTVYPVSVAMAEEFVKMNPDVNIPVQSTGTGGGFNNFFIPGKTDINDASREIKQSEIDAAKANGIEPIEFQVASDGVTMVVNPNADWIDDVSIDQLAEIWGPDDPPTMWNEVNSSWPEQEFELYGPTSSSGTFDFFTETVVGEEDASRSDFQGTEQDNTIVQAVSGSEGAMGYFGLAYYLENESRVKALAVDGVKPSIETAKSGEYPLSRPLFIYVAKNSLERPEVRAFLRFYLENIDGEIIRQIGYVPMTEEDAQAQMEKFEQAVAEVTGE